MKSASSATSTVLSSSLTEVVTGFRVGLGGAQGYFNVVPDLTIFGKVIAGGYPSAGGVGGKKNSFPVWLQVSAP